MWSECDGCEFAPQDISDKDKPCNACRNPVELPEIGFNFENEIKYVLYEQEDRAEHRKTEARKMQIAKKKIPYEDLYSIVLEMSFFGTDDDYEGCPLKYPTCPYGEPHITERLKELNERIREVSDEAYKGYRERVERRVRKKIRIMKEWDKEHGKGDGEDGNQ